MRRRGRGWLAAALVGLAPWLGAAAAAGADAPGRCVATAPDMEGPFYKPGVPLRAATGAGLAVAGVVRSLPGCAPLAGARVEWWQANAAGAYDDAHRGALLSGEGGRYRLQTDFPPPYAGRPAHVHVKVFAPGHRTLTTQVYPRPGQTDIALDLVLTKE